MPGPHMRLKNHIPFVVQPPVGVQTYASVKIREIFGINFREWGIKIYFAGINFNEQSILENFVTINFLKSRANWSKVG